MEMSEFGASVDDVNMPCTPYLALSPPPHLLHITLAYFDFPCTLHTYARSSLCLRRGSCMALFFRQLDML